MKIPTYPEIIDGALLENLAKESLNEGQNCKASKGVAWIILKTLESSVNFRTGDNWKFLYPFYA